MDTLICVEYPGMVQNPDKMIETVKVCSSNILEVIFFPDSSTLLVLEENNCLNVIYSCPITGLVKQKHKILEGNVITYEFIVSQQLFVYSNGFRVFQIQIYFDESIHEVRDHVQEIKLAGIVAISCEYILM